MQTEVHVDQELLRRALAATGARTAEEAVELGLRWLLLLKAQTDLRELKGQVDWEGDLEAIRSSR